MLPLDRYAKALEQPGFLPDPAQREVVEKLDRIYRELSDQGEGGGWFGRLRRRFGNGQRTPVRGLYLWGGVGRGKTHLVDLFVDCLPQERVLRMHFHRFMQRVHQELKSLAGTPNPLRIVAEHFAEDARVLCFDEFFVSDIGDAMILAELLNGLFSQGMTLIATSNVAPARLYENGLQRRRFLPAIELIEQHTDVHHMPDGEDYRLRVLEQAEIFHSPLDAAAESSLAESFRALAPEAPLQDQVLMIEGRPILARQVADDVAWFEFAELCEGPRSQNDYIELSRIFHAVLISNVPRFDLAREDAARRFISLVDEFYDRGVKLILSAAVPVTELYQAQKLRFEFERTQSRLIEMQSHEYLARAHRA